MCLETNCYKQVVNLKKPITRPELDFEGVIFIKNKQKHISTVFSLV